MPARLREIILTAGGLNKVKYLFFFLIAVLFLSSCSAYLSIEKRKYRDGFHVEQNLFRQKEILTRSTQSKHIDPQGDFGSAPFANISAPSAVNDFSQKNIMIEKLKIQLNEIVFLNDTLPKKEKHKKKHDAPQKFDEMKDVTKGNKRMNVFAMIGFVASLLAILYPPLAFLTLLSCLTGLWQIKKYPEKYDGEIFAIIGLLLSIFFIALILFVLL